METQDMPQDMNNADTKVIGHSTPLRAVRRHCLWCCNGSFNEVRLCLAKSCPLWPFRHGRNPAAAERAAVAGQPVHPLERTLAGASGLKAIRRRCLDCSGGTDAAVRSCAFSDCALHAFRFGRNPNIVRSPERKEADARRLALAKASALAKRLAGNPDIWRAHVLEGQQSPG
jgi:hypothetical protein